MAAHVLPDRADIRDVVAEIARVLPETALRASTLEHLIARMRSSTLLGAVTAWRDALEGSSQMPNVALVRGLAPELETSSFLAARQGADDVPVFRFEAVGRDLTERLGRDLRGELVTGEDEDVVGTLPAAYRRVARTRLPTYEYARYAFDDGPPVRFERLIFPASDDGKSVSHLFGLVLFDGFSRASP